MNIVHVNLPNHAYPIYIGIDLLNQSQVLTSHIQGQQVLVVTQKNIAEFHLENLQKKMSSYKQDVCYLNDGEHYKNLNEWQKIFDILVQNKHERSTTLIALGGGVVGDIAGFAAGCYQRGTNYIQIPTTLIAQVDSAIGGKTGVNYGGRKNFLGMFYQPQCVIVDINFIKTLPQREYIAGLAEVIKYALISDENFFHFLENNANLILTKNPDVLLQIITKSISIKADIVTQDERDLGIRNLLNFGHTFAHALEAATDFKKFLHGEAVAIGMLMAAKASQQRGMLTHASVNRIENLLAQYELLIPCEIEFSDLIPYMQQDKKVQNGKLQLILLEAIGRAVKVE